MVSAVFILLSSGHGDQLPAKVRITCKRQHHDTEHSCEKNKHSRSFYLGNIEDMKPLLHVFKLFLNVAHGRLPRFNWTHLISKNSFTKNVSSLYLKLSQQSVD